MLHEPFGSEQLLISDSGIIHFYMDGPSLSPLKAVNKKRKNSYELITQNYNGTYDTTRIWIIDPAKGIAVICYDGIYSLMIDTRQVRNFPIIVCYHPMHRTPAYEGEPINYPALIKKAECE